MANSQTFRVSQYAPANETAADIWYEVCNLDGAMVVAVAYGVHATLFFCCLGALWEQRKKLPLQTYAYIVYICLQFAFGTIAFACNARFNEMLFITDRDYPGGPNAFFVDFQSHWAVYVGYVFYICMAWLQDILLIWRLFIFWERKHYMLVVPGSLFIVSFVLGAMLLAQIGQPGANVWQSVSFNIFTIWFAIEISTTIYITTLIVARLVMMKYRLRKIFGPSYHSPYLSIAAMLIESGLMYSVAALVFLISYVRNSPFQNMVLNMVGQIEAIAPVLIILRVAQGRGLGPSQLKATTETMRTGGGSMLPMKMSKVLASAPAGEAVDGMFRCKTHVSIPQSIARN
ncbi:hypothetical protein AURDEDRAFT_164417 [Auricularia subglabra TFB-10046 SS5]|nr:hypothetical protein AURDEDRAFT_164417 [Auricularia subglabra TFB-10046 SS5]